MPCRGRGEAAAEPELFGDWAVTEVLVQHLVAETALPVFQRPGAAAAIAGAGGPARVGAPFPAAVAERLGVSAPGQAVITGDHPPPFAPVVGLGEPGAEPGPQQAGLPQHRSDSRTHSRQFGDNVLVDQTLAFLPGGQRQRQHLDYVEAPGRAQAATQADPLRGLEDLLPFREVPVRDLLGVLAGERPGLAGQQRQLPRDL